MTRKDRRLNLLYDRIPCHPEMNITETIDLVVETYMRNDYNGHQKKMYDEFGRKESSKN